MILCYADSINTRMGYLIEKEEEQSALTSVEGLTLDFQSQMTSN